MMNLVVLKRLCSRLALLWLATRLTLKIGLLRMRQRWRQSQPTATLPVKAFAPAPFFRFAMQPNRLDNLRIERTWVRDFAESLRRMPQRPSQNRGRRSARLFAASAERLTDLICQRLDVTKVPSSTTVDAYDHFASLHDVISAWLRFSGAEQGWASLTTLKTSARCIPSLSAASDRLIAAPRHDSDQQNVRCQLDQEIRERSQQSIREAMLQEYAITATSIHTETALVTPSFASDKRPQTLGNPVER